MSPVTHFFAGWLLASVSPVQLTRKEKALVVAASVAPDLDGLGLIPELLTRHSSHPLLWFTRYHHSLHTLAFSLVCTATALLIVSSSDSQEPNAASRNNRVHPWATALLVFLSFHLHLLCDLAGSRGPDGDQWPIPYLQPFSSALQLTWHGQWALNAWQNLAITLFLLSATFWIAYKQQASPVELFSIRGDRALVDAIHRRLQ